MDFTTIYLKEHSLWYKFEDYTNAYFGTEGVHIFTVSYIHELLLNNTTSEHWLQHVQSNDWSTNPILVGCSKWLGSVPN